MSDPQSRFFNSGRLRLHYVVWGDESRPALILLHGSRDHARMWDFVAEELLREFAVYAPDLRGHGDSDWAVGGAYRLSDYLLDLSNFFAHLGLEKASLVGHSLAARIVLDYAGTFPEKVDQLVSIEAFEDFEEIEPSASPMQQIRSFVERVRQIDKRAPRTYGTMEEAEQRMLEANPWLTADLVKHQTKHAVRQQEDGTYAWKFDSQVAAQRSPDWPESRIAQIWKAIQAPTLLIGGEGWSSSIHPEFARKTISTARIEVIEGAGHWLHQDHYEEFMGLLRAFLSD